MPINSLSSHTPSLTSCTCVVYPSYNWWANIDKWWWKFTVHLRVHLMLTVLWVLTSLIMCICPYITQNNLTAFHIPSPPSIDPFFPLGWSNHWSFYHFHSFASFFLFVSFFGGGVSCSIRDLCPLVQFGPSVMSVYLWPHGLQHASLPCPSPTPGACSNSCLLSPSDWD